MPWPHCPETYRYRDFKMASCSSNIASISIFLSFSLAANRLISTLHSHRYISQTWLCLLIFRHDTIKLANRVVEHSFDSSWDDRSGSKGFLEKLRNDLRVFGNRLRVAWKM